MIYFISLLPFKKIKNVTIALGVVLRLGNIAHKLSKNTSNTHYCIPYRNG